MIDSLPPLDPQLAALYREQQDLEDYLRTLGQSSVLNAAGAVMPAGPAPPSAMERIGMSLSQAPPYIPGRNDSRGERIAGGLLSGFARGFGQQTNLAVAARVREAEREQEQAAAANRARIAASNAHRAEVAKAASTLANKRWDKMLNPDKTLQQIEDEAAARARGAAKGNPGGGPEDDEAIELTPDGLAVAALNYARSGQLPPMGMGRKGAAVRAKIINYAARMNPNLDVAGNRASFTADRSALTLLQRQLDAYSSYDKTVRANSKVLRDAMSKIRDTQSPLLNRSLRSLDRTALGSADQAAYDAAVQVVVPEFARLLNNPNLTGQLTDTARKELEGIVDRSFTLRQIEAALKVLEQDAANRISTSQQQVDEIKSRIGASPWGNERPALGGGGTIRMAGPDGIPRRVPVAKQKEAEANGMKVVP